MNKFRVKTDLEVGKMYGRAMFTAQMAKTRGKIGTVLTELETDVFDTDLSKDNVFSREMLEFGTLLKIECHAKGFVYIDKFVLPGEEFNLPSEILPDQIEDFENKMDRMTVDIYSLENFRVQK